MSTAAVLVNDTAARARTLPAVLKERWGFPEFFVISQTAIPALLYFPGTQPFRLYIRIASFVISFATLIWWAVAAAKTSRTHPAQPWIFAAHGVRRRHVLSSADRLRPSPASRNSCCISR